MVPEGVDVQNRQVYVLHQHPEILVALHQTKWYLAALAPESKVALVLLYQGGQVLGAVLQVHVPLLADPAGPHVGSRRVQSELQRKCQSLLKL